MCWAAGSPAAREAVRGAIEQLDYVPNRAARTLAGSRTMAIAVVVPEEADRFFGDPFFAAVVAGADAAVAASDYMLTLTLAGGGAGEKVVGYARSGSLDGAIIVSPHRRDAFVERVAAAVPVVYGGRPFAAGGFSVDVANATGAEAAVNHLIVRGRRAIATIAGPPSMPAAVDRREGYRRALAAAGIADGEIAHGDFTAAPPAARSACSRRRGCGCPTTSRSSASTTPRPGRGAAPRLTTVRRPSFDQGRRLAEVLIELLAGGDPPRSTVLPTELIVRDTA